MIDYDVRREDEIEDVVIVVILSLGYRSVTLITSCV